MGHMSNTRVTTPTIPVGYDLDTTSEQELITAIAEGRASYWKPIAFHVDATDGAANYDEAPEWDAWWIA